MEQERDQTETINEEDDEEMEISGQGATADETKVRWGKKLCGLNWRIDVPVKVGEEEDDDEVSAPHAVLEAVFSTVDDNGTENFETEYIRVSKSKLEKIVDSFSKAADFAKKHN
ncbi:uncharacterized protein MONOS_3851 [Monocercomonoides exilis]|uniref:uncharacterized protein n=1 Tax=Monocercomonoides exilis TaxID=2049356 RepID=UPI0035597ECE|nr:hypothetical protein MONOS_3620 [Monocercomonoides exilis]KAH7826839.1 hypothetical protein MONOS_3851 [Monocercomonoides exilis]|eukprot:MONOS_3620.1-p1 / transcript=MONOS_3620.1 / gene=MONOS_3620 / organism=Monocercomonoides_exilis_PA203 / gene_product=unspecified product / transcript_product=unspecified product / location=Mono_scaffold00086:121572-121960(-) / protein_length=114 / sequence_SO=supercontig / SO=protein_coding / is_pseudo=false